MDNRVKVQCLECGKKWKTASSLPQCSRCNSVDVEPVEELEAAARERYYDHFQRRAESGHAQ